jgi:acyl-CoA reductase-like NAD-dependent aldehyde dehydrogenase
MVAKTPRSKDNSPPRATVGSPAFPAAESKTDADRRTDIDRAVAELKSRKRDWAQLPIQDRITLLEAVQASFASVAERWMEACIRAKGLGSGTFAEGEEWVIYTLGVRALGYFHSSLEAIQKDGRPPVPGGLRTDNAGRTIARVFPARWTDRILFRGITSDVWMQDGVTADDVRREQAWAYHHPSDGEVAVVLGAGNLSVLPLLDTLNRLFVKLQVVVLKTNPIMDYMDPIMADALHPLIEAGFLRMVRGGAEQGQYLTHHPDVDSIQMTGSDKTFQRIMFGKDLPPDGPDSSTQATLEKPISAELGSVTPLIVVPGPWTRSDIRHKTLQLASWMAVNASFNCLSPRIMVQHAEWPLRDAFMTSLEEMLAEIPTRKAYYPGAEERHARFASSHVDVRQIGDAQADELPWTVIRGIDPESDDMAFRREVFCSVLSETALHAESTVDFIDRAVDFANQRLWGTLLISLFVHPRSLADPEIRSAVERAIADLRYGTVCINLRGEYGYYPLLSPWGGAPGSPMYDVQSGLGVINNPLMFKSSQKTVVRGPFRQWPDPFLATFDGMSAFGPALFEFEKSHALARLPKVLLRAVL